MFVPNREGVFVSLSVWFANVGKREGVDERRNAACKCCRECVRLHIQMPILAEDNNSSSVRSRGRQCTGTASAAADQAQPGYVTPRRKRVAQPRHRHGRGVPTPPSHRQTAGRQHPHAYTSTPSLILAHAQTQTHTSVVHPRTRKLKMPPCYSPAHHAQTCTPVTHTHTHTPHTHSRKHTCLACWAFLWAASFSLFSISSCSFCRSLLRAVAKSWLGFGAVLVVPPPAKNEHVLRL